jgi:hypothetical protein
MGESKVHDMLTDEVKKTLVAQNVSISLFLLYRPWHLIIRGGRAVNFYSRSNPDYGGVPGTKSWTWPSPRPRPFS